MQYKILVAAHEAPTAQAPWVSVQGPPELRLFELRGPAGTQSTRPWIPRALGPRLFA